MTALLICGKKRLSRQRYLSKKHLLGKCAGISFADSTPWMARRNRRDVDGAQLANKLKNNMKGAWTSVADELLPRKRALIETIDDELENIAQIGHSRHRPFNHFVVNLSSGIAAYCRFPKEPSMNLEKYHDNLRVLF